MSIKGFIGSLLCSIILLGNNSCTKKDLDIEVVQDECKRFRISNPTYSLLEDPCNDSTRIYAEVNFNFSKTSDCLWRVINSPKFYDRSNTEITPLTYTNPTLKEEINIGDKEASYSFEAVFANLTLAKDLNHLILDFNTQNELGVASNTLQIRINTSCSIVDSSAYDINPNEVNIPPGQSLFTIRLWDNAAEDGDIVSVYLNGNWIIENHSLLKAGTDFNFSTSLLNQGANDLVVFALNEGTSGPNTVSIAVNGTEIQNFKPGLLTGEAVRINF